MFSSKSIAQKSLDDQVFDSIFVEIATKTMVENSEIALKRSDSLLKLPLNTEQRIKALMLSAEINNNLGEVKQSVYFAIAAQKLAIQSKNLDWEIRIGGFLATSYRSVGLNKMAEVQIQNVDRLIGNSSKPLMKLFVLQEQSFLGLANKEYQKTLDAANKSIAYYQEVPKQKTSPLLIVPSYYLQGIALLNLGFIDSAKNKLEFAKHEMKVFIQHPIYGFILLGLGEIAMMEKQFTTSIQYYEQTEEIYHASQNFQLGLMVYKQYEELFRSLNNEEKVYYYKRKYLELVEKQYKISSEIANDLLSNSQSESASRKKGNIILFIISSFLLLFVVLLIYFYKKRDNKLKHQFDEILKENQRKYQYQSVIINQDKPQNEFFSEYNDKSNLLLANPTNKEAEKEEWIKEETVKNILIELVIFEQEQLFLEKDLTLASLATRIKTNTKYLSHVINSKRGKDFNSYINELRIDFIIDKLIHQPEFRTYKITYLAELCGISSHSKFSNLFKRFKGISPSDFIKNLK